MLGVGARLPRARVWALALSVTAISAGVSAASAGASPARLDQADSSAPVATDDTYSTPAGHALTVAAPGVLANDSGGDGSALSAVLVAEPSHGLVQLAAGGGFTYTPSLGYAGPDSFTYTATDGTSTSNVATVTITVVNHPPVAGNDSYSTLAGQELDVPAPGVLANDTDPDGDVLLTEVVSGPAHGTLMLGFNGAVHYVPAAGFEGVDTFTYRASDVISDSNVATVTIDVVGTNRPPAAVGDAYTALHDRPLVVPAGDGLLANDTDPDGDALTAVFDAGPAHGVVTLNSDGSFTYSPASGFTGMDSFTYEASDGQALSAPATVTIAVTDAAPVAVPDAYQMHAEQTLTIGAASGVLANDTDADGDALSATLATGPAHGSLALGPDGSFTYTPAAGFAGTDSFSYTASDGAATSAPATVTIGVVNDAPVVTAASGGACRDDSTHAAGTLVLSVSDAETPASGLAVSATSSDQGLIPPSGIAVSGTDTRRTLSVSTADRLAGSATITVTVADGDGGSSTLAVGLAVGGGSNDVLTGTDGPDLLFGMAGADTLSGLGGADLLCGGNGDDVLSGGAGNDALFGGNGADVLSGGDDADVLSGGAGDDQLTGGAGADRFSGGMGDNLFTDVNAGEGDTVVG
jgi:VCBS repeat-containing protein